MNIPSLPTLAAASVAAASLVSGCADAGPDLGTSSAAAQTADKGVAFEDASDLLDFSRVEPMEGLGGIAWLDYDNDGDLDLYLTNGIGAANGLFRNDEGTAFVDVSAAAGVAIYGGNSGVIAGDIDNDGHTDLFLTGEGHLVGPFQTPNVLLHNKGDGTFEEITDFPGNPGSALGASFGDINGDGYLDIFVASPGHIPFLTGSGSGESHPNKLYLNDGASGNGLAFTDISESAGIEGLYPAPAYYAPYTELSDGACVSAFTDYDGDGDADILVGNCNAFPPGFISEPVRPTPFNLYRNNGDNTFTDVASTAFADDAPIGFWMGLALGDFDNDGDIDFFATSTGSFMNMGLLHVRMSNNGDGTFTNVAGEEADVEFGWGATTADFDNDGHLDLYQVGSLPLFGAIGPTQGSPGRLYFNDGNDQMIDSTGTGAAARDLSSHYTSGVVQGDFDSDGFADLVVMTAPWTARDPATGDVVAANPDGQAVLLHNQGNGNNSINLRLVGTASNRSAIGAIVSVKGAGVHQVREVRSGSSMASTNSPWPSFGIGQRTHGTVKVSWPSGLEESFGKVDAGDLVTLVEGTGEVIGD